MEIPGSVEFKHKVGDLLYDDSSDRLFVIYKIMDEKFPYYIEHIGNEEPVIKFGFSEWAITAMKEDLKTYMSE